MFLLEPSGSRTLSSTSLGVASDALSLTDPLMLPFVAAGTGPEPAAVRGSVEVIPLPLLLTTSKLQRYKVTRVCK